MSERRKIDCPLYINTDEGKCFAREKSPPGGRYLECAPDDPRICKKYTKDGNNV